MMFLGFRCEEGYPNVVFICNWIRYHLSIRSNTSGYATMDPGELMIDLALIERQYVVR